MRSRSQVRGASFVQYMVGLALAIALAAGGVAVYRVALAKGSGCLGERVTAAGAGGRKCGETEPKASPPAIS